MLMKRTLFVFTGFIALIIVTIGINQRAISSIVVFRRKLRAEVKTVNISGQGGQDVTPAGSLQDVTVENLYCHVNVSTLEQNVTLSDRMYGDDTEALDRLTEGGTFIPVNCTPKENVAIIVPYRDRQEHLDVFLPYMHQFLQKQMISYTIFIVEQDDSELFNRGLLMNVGYLAAMSIDNFTCLVLHDVDLLPTNENNIYECTTKAKHMSTANSKYKYKLPYPTYFGGVISIQPGSFEKANGFSNLYFGWGQEDDDFYTRIKAIGLSYNRTPNHLGRYEALNHTLQNMNKTAKIQRKMLVQTIRKRQTSDGINSITHEQTMLMTKPRYTLVKVRTNETDLSERFFACSMRWWPCPMKDIT